MRRRVGLWVLGLVLLTGGVATAQVPVPSPVPPTTRLLWDHDGVNVATWTLTIDGTDQAITPTQAGASWSIAFPALTPGAHTLNVSACNVSGCGKSDDFLVSVVVVPAKPTGLRISSTP